VSAVAPPAERAGQEPRDAPGVGGVAGEALGEQSFLRVRLTGQQGGEQGGQPGALPGATTRPAANSIRNV